MCDWRFGAGCGHVGSCVWLQRGWLVSLPLRAAPPPNSPEPWQTLPLLERRCRYRWLRRPASGISHAHARNNARWQAGLEKQGGEEGRTGMSARERQTCLLELPLNVRALHERRRRTPWRRGRAQLANLRMLEQPVCVVDAVRRGAPRMHPLALDGTGHGAAQHGPQQSAAQRRHALQHTAKIQACGSQAQEGERQQVGAGAWVAGRPSPLGSPSPRPLMPVDARQGASARRSVNVALASTSVSVSVSSNMSVSSNVSGSWIASEMVGCLGAQQSPRCPWLCLAQATPAGSVCAWARVCGD